MNTDSCTDEQLQGSPVDRRALRITSITDSKHVPVEFVRDLEWGRKSNKLRYTFPMIRKSLDGRLCTYMHDARYTRSRLVSWIHMYSGDEQEVRKGERIEVQKRRPHSASKSESSRG